MKALLVVDIQNGLTLKKKLFNQDIFFETVNFAIKKFKENNELVLFIQHNNKSLIMPNSDWDIDFRIIKEKSDFFIQKRHGNSFQNTELLVVLKHHNIDEVIVCGLSSHGCVKHTCIGSREHGFKTKLLTDGHTCWNLNAAEKVHLTELELNRLGIINIDKNDI